jgi:hypothetical protein
MKNQLNTLKWFAIIMVTTAFVVGAIVIGKNYYETKKKNEITFSDRLEQSQGFLKIKLGTSIEQYPGFVFRNSVPNEAGIDLSQWEYKGGDGKYSKIGEYKLRDYAFEKIRDNYFENLLTDAQIKELPEVYLFVFTNKRIIVGIEAQVMENQVQNGGHSNFNYDLEKVYGPTNHANQFGGNEIAQNIQVGQTVSWESPTVMLISKNINVERYKKNGSMYSYEAYKMLDYYSKAFMEQMKNGKNKQADEKINNLKENL